MTDQKLEKLARLSRLVDELCEAAALEREKVNEMKVGEVTLKAVLKILAEVEDGQEK